MVDTESEGILKSTCCTCIILSLYKQIILCKITIEKCLVSIYNFREKESS